MLGLLLVLVVVFAGAVITRNLLAQDLDNNVARVPAVFQGLEDNARPPASDALTFLVVGNDSPSPQRTTDADPTGVARDAQPGEVLLLARINAARTAASVVSIPSDSWVDVLGHGPNTIKSAYGFGGPPLLITAIEKLTGIRIDHFVKVDFAGLPTVIDAVGGIDVHVLKPTNLDGSLLERGPHHLDGAQAFAYMRQRHDLPRAEPDRAQRRENVLRSLLQKAVGSELSANPIQLYRLLDAASRATSVDDTVTPGGIRELRTELRSLQPAAVTFLGAPIRGAGQEGAQSITYLDHQRALELWSALRSDSAPSYASRYPDASFGATPP